jgi:hypothetical protein
MQVNHGCRRDEGTKLTINFRALSATRGIDPTRDENGWQSTSQRCWQFAHIPYSFPIDRYISVIECGNDYGQSDLCERGSKIEHRPYDTAVL